MFIMPVYQKDLLWYRFLVHQIRRYFPTKETAQISKRNNTINENSLQYKSDFRWTMRCLK